MRPRLAGVLGGLATACAMALAACGGEETTVEQTMSCLDVEGGTAVDNIVDVYFWGSKEAAARYVKRVGDGPLDELHHEQLGTATITYSHEGEHAEAEHDEESEAIDHEVEAIAACVA
jgi:hypothetical protein